METMMLVIYDKPSYFGKKGKQRKKVGGGGMLKCQKKLKASIITPSQKNMIFMPGQQIKCE